MAESPYFNKTVGASSLRNLGANAYSRTSIIRIHSSRTSFQNMQVHVHFLRSSVSQPAWPSSQQHRAAMGAGSCRPLSTTLIDDHGRRHRVPTLVGPGVLGESSARGRSCPSMQWGRLEMVKLGGRRVRALWIEVSGR